MVERLRLCCGLFESDMDWEGTSQIPELKFLCQPGIPAARPGGLLAKKVPKAFHLQCHVDYTVGWAKGQLPIMSSLTWQLSFSLFPTPSLFLYFFTPSKPERTKENRCIRVNPLNSSCPQGLTHLSVPAMGCWNKGGYHDNNSATMPKACVLWTKKRGEGSASIATRMFSQLAAGKKSSL